MSSIGYRADIDGLRAIAVLPVILFHMDAQWIPGGFIGVDVFFVISGFLITAIIRNELKEGTFSFRRFWSRRIRRILPAMTFVSACTLAITYFFVFRPDQQAIGSQGLAAMLSAANIYFWHATGDYWGSAAEQSPFLHAWSLSVEEQFYLIYPILFWVIHRYRSSWLASCILLAALVSLSLFLRGLAVAPTATFYLLPTRIWELAAGGLLALSPASHLSNQGRSEVYSAVGLGMIVLSYLSFDALNAGVGIAVAGASLVIAFGQTGLSNRLLTLRPLVHVGKLSYSLYLWHWPLMVLANTLGLNWPGPSDKIALVSLIYVLALGTYKAIETPFRQRGGSIPLILANGLLVAAVAFGMSRVPRYYDISAFEQSVWMHNVYNVFPNAGSIRASARTYGIKMPPPQHAPEQFRNGGIVYLRSTSSPEVVLLGDSHAIMWADAINDITQKHDISTAFYAMSGRDPFCEIPPEGRPRNVSVLPPEMSLEVDQTMLEKLSEWKPKVVLISCFWDRIDEQQSTQLIEWLEDHGIRALLIEDPPHLAGFDAQNAMQFAIWRGMVYTGQRQYWPAEKKSPNTLVHRIAERFPHVGVVSVHKTYENDKHALLFDDRQCVYVDNDHLTNYGAKLASGAIESAILTATERHHLINLGSN